MLDHLKRWNIWRKNNSNGPIHKILVLLGLRYSPTMVLILTYEEKKSIERTYGECDLMNV